MTPDQRTRWAKLVCYSLGIGAGAAATAYLSGTTDWRKLLAAAIVAMAGSGGGYWATSPKTKTLPADGGGGV